LVDHVLDIEASGALARLTAAIPRRIVMVTPAQRHDLAALNDSGFTGYLIKPVRAASLAERSSSDDGFETGSTTDAAEPPRAQASGSGLSVLVAEDNEINALLTRTMLTKLGHRPTMVGTGSAAVDCWVAARSAGMPFDRVLMDLHMPNMDGFEATRRIRELEAEAKAAPTLIVALTANAAPEDRDAALAAGMDDFLVKPLDRDRLAAALDGENASAVAA
jgi:CheY-like chemotaxis protein